MEEEIHISLEPHPTLDLLPVAKAETIHIS